MKKLVSILFFCMSSQMIKAQVNLGVELGVQASNLQNQISIGISTGSSVNITMGFVGDIKLAKAWSASSGIVYSPFAYTSSNIQAANQDGNDLGIVTKHKIDYLQIPLTIKYHAPLNNSIGFWGGSGIVVNFKLSDKMTFKQNFGLPLTNPTIIGTKGINSSNTAFNILLGIDYKKAYGSIQFQRTLSDIYKAQVPGQNWGAGLVRVSVGYYILKK